MQYLEVRALLQDIKTYLVTGGWPLSRRRRRAHLLRRLDAIAALLDVGAHPAVAVAMTRLEGAPVLRIDADEAYIEETPEGVWVSGWIWVEQQAFASCDAMRMMKLRNAIADLPQQTHADFDGRA